MTRTEAHRDTAQRDTARATTGQAQRNPLRREHRATEPGSAGAPLQRTALERRPATAPRRSVTPPTDIAHALADALRGYVKAVAVALGVPAEGVTCEVTDTVTAYLALGHRATAFPDRDVMLVWDARGWSVSLETDPGERPIVLSASTGDLVPDPATVAGFVSIALARRTARPASPATTEPLDWTQVVERMRGHGR
ncbi:DUF6292 family protein [Actinokineospora globicatena]|uniref:DUF6292 family protein n=1 Tax=Actinokineospora globicatena TaxID=103729 RepID=UPI0020A4D3F4|nr:DUF6292 family protein [Actinokineospora globicatena]MCP2306776.1 hypothetical protein [Actinokineospora globicatena]GLW82103.1 hypothetical protein Aglo01_65840 [Actinokineospora globicatena]GLW88896.1 hypothetical protein Aglo02_65350 [Actinokineospora globicatena]